MRLLKSYLVPVVSGGLAGFLGSFIVARLLHLIMIVSPFDMIIAYLLITIAWFALLDSKPDSAAGYFFCKGCMVGSVPLLASVIAVGWVGADERALMPFVVLCAVGLGIGHILGRIIVTADAERSYFRSIKRRS